MSADARTDVTSPSPLADLTGFQRDLLREIDQQDLPSGSDIQSALRPFYGVVHHARLYPSLDDLVEEGLVIKGRKDKRTNTYRLSELGRLQLDGYRSWLDGDDGAGADTKGGGAA